jgi:hypothetical protein
MPASHLTRLVFRKMMRQILDRLPAYGLEQSSARRYPDRGLGQVG